MKYLVLSIPAMAMGYHLAFTQCTATNLIISQYLEGSSNNKCIEVYNGTGSSVDLDETNYDIAMYFNGSNSASTTVQLVGGVIESGDVWVLCDDETTVYNTPDQGSNASFFNGDDAIALLHDDVIIDVFGQVGFDPGSEWNNGGCSTQNNGLVRDLSAGPCPVDTIPGDAFDPAAWASGGLCLGEDDITDLGLPEPPLAISLISFKLQEISENVVNLFWTVQFSEDGEYVEVQQSIDNAAFQTISTFEYTGNRTELEHGSYQVDCNTGRRFLFRLRMVNPDGSIRYSHLLAYKAGPGLADAIKVFPTPAEKQVTITGLTDEDWTLSVFNAHGGLLKTLDVHAMPETSLDLSGLRTGIYILQLNSTEYTRSLRIIKR